MVLKGEQRRLKWLDRKRSVAYVPDGVLSQMLGDLQDEPRLPAGDVEGVEDLGKAILELDVDDGSDDGEDLALKGEEAILLISSQFQVLALVSLPL